MTLAPFPFNGYTVYGPSIHQGRRIVYLVRERHDRVTLAYAKYLMSIHVGRWLTREEKVHHKNEDKLDDRIENYEIVTDAQHGARHTKGMKMADYICGFCGDEFTRRDDGKPHKHCSRECHYNSMRGPK